MLLTTSDNRTEFPEHKLISKKINTEFFFAHPYSSWERELSEYTNKRVKQYTPKKTDFKLYSNFYLIDIQHKTNKKT